VKFRCEEHQKPITTLLLFRKSFFYIVEKGEETPQEGQEGRFFVIAKKKPWCGVKV